MVPGRGVLFKGTCARISPCGRNGRIMPTIAMFCGIIIRMYCSPKEHNPPHFHAYHQDSKAIVDIRTCEIIDGQLPTK